ncbi:MAG TPA: competence/damage-inducible protein A [Gemmatimonadaceae bacterium]|nr:competence/damage-inducible protein A [Gemmatimonadaceae bacterium]
MRVELLTVGDELLLGFTVDTNAAFLARTLAAEGIAITRRSTVGDDAESIAAAVEEALSRTGAVITTGGLGPTSDDATKPAIARLFGRELTLDEEILRDIQEKFRRFGYRGEMPPGNRQQALIPEHARILYNKHGTAPGIWLEDERGRWVAMLPGVPREMRGMTEDTLVPLLRERLRAINNGVPRVVLSRTIRTTGIGESALAQALGDDEREIDGIPVAYLPGWEGVDLRLTVRDRTREDAERTLDAAAAHVYARVARHVYGEDGTDLAAVVLDLARARGLRIATAESCTGGMLGARITAVPGSSDVYAGGVVAYENAVKEQLLGVSPNTLAAHGAVSEEVVREMAQGVRAALGTAIGVGITGIAGPGGGTADKPVGTVWLGAAVENEVRAARRQFVGDREEIRRRACQSALEMVRQMLSGASGR